MTDTTHRLIATVHYATEAQLTRWSDDGRPFVDPVWTKCPDTFVATCQCGRTMSGETEADALSAHAHHAAYEARSASQGVTA